MLKVSLFLRSPHPHPSPHRRYREDLTLGRSTRHSPLPCINDVDDEPYPSFIWTDRLLLPTSVRDRPLSEDGACVCDEEGEGGTSCCRDTRCACYLRAYGEHGGVGGDRPPSRPALWECGERCRCHSQMASCRLRTTQHTAPPGVGLALRKSSKGKGWGVFARGPVPPHAFVGEYTGELIGTETARARMAEYDKTGLNYVLVVREETVSPAESVLCPTLVSSTLTVRTACASTERG